MTLCLIHYWHTLLTESVGHIHIVIGPLSMHLHPETPDPLAQLAVDVFLESIAILGRLAITLCRSNYGSLKISRQTQCITNSIVSDFQKWPWPFTQHSTWGILVRIWECKDKGLNQLHFKHLFHILQKYMAMWTRARAFLQALKEASTSLRCFIDFTVNLSLSSRTMAWTKERKRAIYFSFATSCWENLMRYFCFPDHLNDKKHQERNGHLCVEKIREATGVLNSIRLAHQGIQNKFLFSYWCLLTSPEISRI